MADPGIVAGPDAAAEAVREEPAADIEAVDLAERPVPEAVTEREQLCCRKSDRIHCNRLFVRHIENKT